MYWQTHRQTHRHTTTAYTALSIASRGKNFYWGGSDGPNIWLEEGVTFFPSSLESPLNIGLLRKRRRSAVLHRSRFRLQHFPKDQTTPKSSPSRGGYSNTWFLLIRVIPKRDLNRFSRFCRVHGQTDRQTDRQTNQSYSFLAIGCILAKAAIRPNHNSQKSRSQLERGRVVGKLYGNTYAFWRKVQNSHAANVTYLGYLA